MNTLDRLTTFHALGPVNLLRVGLYRILLSKGLHRSQRLQAQAASGPFFDSGSAEIRAGLAIRSDWQPAVGRYRLFGRQSSQSYDFSTAPNWFLSSFSGQTANSESPWWRIGDFSESLGDIKAVWELSRFDWVLALSQQVAMGDERSLAILNDWLEDWSRCNLPYCGVNWKCGQEASIRVMHLSAALLVLDDIKMTDGLRQLLLVHLQRIAPTIHYAVGQSNNHATSEAGALFIGGALLGGYQGERWERLGRKWLEDRAKFLIEGDGTFSQYSVNYHRLMLDTYSLCETWRRKLNRPAFSATLQHRLSAATSWLCQMVDPRTGHAPNLGANDGAQLIRLSECDYSDYRPSVQLASTLFQQAFVYDAGPWDEQLRWLGVELPKEKTAPLESATLDEGGISVVRRGEAVAYLRYPRFRFRPSQADALHCDLWVSGENVLTDAGTYSYNATTEDTAYFNGTKSHNTVEFDGRDQMPRLGRFLFGKWLKSYDVEPVSVAAEGVSAAATYTDGQGATHRRRLQLSDNQLLVIDTIEGFKDKATLRWRLGKGNWQLSDTTVKSECVTITVTADVNHEEIRMEPGWSSQYYLEKVPVSVLAVEFRQPAVVTTRISF